MSPSTYRCRWARRVAAVEFVAALAALRSLAFLIAGDATALPSNCSQGGNTVTCTYAYRGSEQTFTVPAGVASLHVVAVGAVGASGFEGPAAGAGGTANTTIAVAAGSVLYVEVGGPGTPGKVYTPVAGGWNGGGGGAGANGGGSGGGASDVRTVSCGSACASGAGFSSLASRLVVAAGGGGSGGFGGAGGAAGEPGAAGSTVSHGGGGGAGTLSAGGAGGSGSAGPAGQDGAAGVGGTGGDGDFGGGGGGGGYYGGGGGGAAGPFMAGGGGGGGASYAPSGTTGPAGGAASVAISYQLVAPQITSATATTFTVGRAGRFEVTTVGVGVASLSEHGQLPSGVTFLDSGDGTASLSGTPAAGAGGTYPVMITASNGATPAAEQSFTLTVDQAPAITSRSSTRFTEGRAGRFAVVGTGVPVPSLSESGALPAGMSFVADGTGTATLSGTPAAGSAGTYPITVLAANGVSPTATQRFALMVARPSVTATTPTRGATTSRTTTASTVASTTPVPLTTPAPTTTTSVAAVTPTPPSGGQEARASRPPRSAPPTVLTNSLPDIGDVFSHPERIGLALATGFVWTLLLVLATNLLQRPLSTRYEQWTAFLERRFPTGARRAARALGLLAGEHWLAILALVEVNGFVLGFVAPNFGFDWTSLRLVGSTVAATLIGIAAPCWLTARVAARRWLVTAHSVASPWGLAIGALGVLVSRLISFVPGLLTGRTIVFEMDDRLMRQRVRVFRLQIVLTLGAGTAAWITAGAIPGRGGWFTLWCRDTAVATVVVAFTGMMLELLPLTFYSGSLLYQHGRRSWALLMAVTAVAFALIVAPQPSNWLYVGKRETWWITVATIAGVAAVAVSLVIHRADAKQQASARPRVS